jgi:hypothetical protein
MTDILVKTKEHAMKCYPANSEGWGHVIEVLQMIVTKGDLKACKILQ